MRKSRSSLVGVAWLLFAFGAVTALRLGTVVRTRPIATPGSKVAPIQQPMTRLGLEQTTSRCAGIGLQPDSAIQDEIEAHPASTFCFSAGRYRVGRALHPRSGQSFVGS